MKRFTVETPDVQVVVSVEWVRDVAFGMSEYSEYDVYLDPDEIWRIGFTVEATSMDEALAAAERFAVEYLVDDTTSLPPLVCHYCGDSTANVYASEAFGEPVCSDCAADAHRQRADCDHDDDACLLQLLVPRRHDSLSAQVSIAMSRNER